MISYDVLETLKAKMGTSSYADRIVSELHFACNLSKALDGRYDSEIAEAINALAHAVSEEGVITKTAALACEQMLLPMQADAKKYRIHCVAHAHIDMNWMWGFQETVSVTVDTFRTVLNLMKEYPSLTFAQSQASTYEIIEKYAPAMLPEIKERVQEGRWEVSASTWVETDKNMPSGESLARHILYTKQYLSRLLDIPPESLSLDFEPDTFGHNISVPEICAAGGAFLTDVTVADIYENNDGVSSITLRLSFTSMEKTLSKAELQADIDAILAALAADGMTLKTV